MCLRHLASLGQRRYYTRSPVDSATAPRKPQLGFRAAGV